MFKVPYKSYKMTRLELRVSFRGTAHTQPTYQMTRTVQSFKTRVL